MSVVKIEKSVAVDMKSSFIFCSQFGAQNAGNGISELPDFNARFRGLTAPISYSWLFFSNQLPTSTFIETPALIFKVLEQSRCHLCFPN